MPIQHNTEQYNTFHDKPITTPYNTARIQYTYNPIQKTQYNPPRYNKKHTRHTRNAIQLKFSGMQYNIITTQQNATHLKARQYNTMQHYKHNTIQFTIQYNTMHHNTSIIQSQHKSGQSNTLRMQHNTIKHITMQYHNCPLRIQHKLQHKLNTTHHNIIQPNSRQYKTIQCTHNQCKTNQINT